VGAVYFPDVQQFYLFTFLKLEAMALPATCGAIHGFILIMAVTNECKHIVRVGASKAKTVQILSYGYKSCSQLISCGQRGAGESEVLIIHIRINNYF